VSASDRSRASSVPGARAVAAASIVALAILAFTALRGPAFAPGAAARQRYRIDVNAADAGELAALPGVGPLLAERIADDRAARGAFASIDDLGRVPGIGPARIERMREFARAGDAGGAAAAAR
jgi:competence protein ComEA